MRPNLARYCGSLVGLALLTALLTATAGAQTPPADVALVTMLSGEVSYWNEAEKVAPSRLQAFMKVRRGDHLKLSRAAALTLLYFASGRQETWRGPATLKVGDGESAAAGSGQAPPEVKLIATKATRQIQGAPSPLPGLSVSRSGGIQTMTPEGLAAAAAPAAPLTAEGQRQIKEAEALYQDMLKNAGPSDITPELYLLSVQGKYGQYADMAKLVEIMRRKQPGEASLRDLRAWAQSKADASEPAAPQGYATRRGRRAMRFEELPTDSQRPEVAEIRDLLKKAHDSEESQHGIAALHNYQQAYQMSERALGPEHPLTAHCMARLARFYSFLGIFDRALPLAQKSLQIRERLLGPDDPRTAQSLWILGFLYGQMGDNSKGLQMNLRALKISEQALGPEDRQTASALNNLAVLYAQMGSYDQALPLARRAAQIREKELGLESLQTASSYAHLGALYLAGGISARRRPVFAGPPIARATTGWWSFIWLPASMRMP